MPPYEGVVIHHRVRAHGWPEHRTITGQDEWKNQHDAWLFPVTLIGFKTRIGARRALAVRKEAVQRAVEEFWSERRAQMEKLKDQGRSGGAARANGHMGGFTNLVAQEFVDAGVPVECIKTGQPYLPGYYRVRKQWDLAIVWEGTLVAAIEFKSQVGSVAKNINNRFEEALGTATDTHAAHSKNEIYGEVPPWLGYVFVLQETSETERRNRSTKALFPADLVFVGMSYSERYQEIIKRFVREHIYQASWFVTTKVTDEGIVYNEPLATASAAAFAVQIKGQVDYVKAVLGEAR